MLEEYKSEPQSDMQTYQDALAEYKVKSKHFRSLQPSSCIPWKLSWRHLQPMPLCFRRQLAGASVRILLLSSMHLGAHIARLSCFMTKRVTQGTRPWRFSAKKWPTTNTSRSLLCTA